MDDLIAVADTAEETIEAQRIIHTALASRGFLLREYSSNSDNLLKIIPSCSFVDRVSVLGINWSPNSDDLEMKSNVRADLASLVVTKRVILSNISRTFNPLGLVMPVTICGKLLLQEVWREGRLWDEPVADVIATSFVEYMCDLSNL